MPVESTREWVITPLDTEDVDPHAIVEITVDFHEGEEVLTPKIYERFGPTTSTRPRATSTSSPTTS
jgi:hypothetical protein